MITKQFQGVINLFIGHLKGEAEIFSNPMLFFVYFELLVVQPRF